MESPRECERCFLCTLSGREGCLSSRNDLNYRIWNRDGSDIRHKGELGSEPMNLTYMLLAQMELLFMGPVVLVWGKR